MKNLTAIIFIVALFLCPPPADAEIYHWVDKNGVPHYSNQKPPKSDVSVSTEAEIPYDAEADRRRREAEAAAYKEDLERESREEQARLKLEAERLAAQRRQAAQPPTIIQNNVYESRDGGYSPPVYCPDGLPPPCRRPVVPPGEMRRRYHKRYYQTSPFYGESGYYDSPLNHRPGRPGAYLPPAGIVPPVGRPPMSRPPVVRPPVHRPPVTRPPVVGRPR